MTASSIDNPIALSAQYGPVRYHLTRDDELKVYGLAMPQTGDAPF